MAENKDRIIQDLKLYKRIPVIIKNLQETKKLKELDLSNLSCSSSTLEEHRCSNYQEYSTTERQAERQEQLKTEIQGIDFKIMQYETLLLNIQRSVDSLDDKERRIIELRFLKGFTWVRIAMELHYSEKWCRGICTAALKTLNVIMYG